MRSQLTRTQGPVDRGFPGGSSRVCSLLRFWATCPIILLIGLTGPSLLRASSATVLLPLLTLFGTQSAQAQTTLPTPKASLPALTGGNKQVMVTWTNPTGITLQANRIRYRKKGTSVWTHADASPTSGNQNFGGYITSATLPANESFTMEDGVTYQFQLRHGKWNGGYGGWGAWSDTAEVQTTAQLPNNVTNLTVTATSTTALEVSWTAPTIAADGYRVEWSQGTSMTPDIDRKELTGGSTTSTSITGLTSGTTYTVRVIALKYGQGTSPSPWPEATGMTNAPTQAPDAVAAVSVVHNGSSLAVSWEAPARATHYDVTYSGNGTNARAAWNRAGTSLTITCDVRPGHQNCIDSGVTYTVGVRARNAAGQSAWVNSAPTGQVPNNVTNLTVTATSTTALEVSWTAPTIAADGYRVEWSQGTSMTPDIDRKELTGGSTTSTSITGLTSGTTYTVRVIALKYGQGTSPSPWPEATGMTNAPTQAPDAVAAVSVVHNGSSLAVSWEAPARATHYDVTYSGNGTNARAAWNRAGTSLTITCDVRPGHQNCIDSGVTYTVGVRARNAAGQSAWVNSAPAAGPALSVGDASVAEPNAGATATLDFVVTLVPASSETVTVSYATADDTATAAADYTSTSGTLTFAAGETSKTVAVPVLADDHNEGRETLTLTLSNASGASIAVAAATGAITNDGPIPTSWNARFGRTVADQVLDAVEERMRTAPTPGVEVNLAGRQLGWPAGSGGIANAAQNRTEVQQDIPQEGDRLHPGAGSNGVTGGLESLTVSGHQLLANSSFVLSSQTSGGGLLSFWGRGAVTSFDGREGELSLDGEVTTAMLGTDWSWGRWPVTSGEPGARRSTAGLLLSHSTADGGYGNRHSAGDSGDVEASLTGVFPWARHRFTHQLEAWGAAGYGQGNLEVTPKLPGTDTDGATMTADLNLWLAAGGLRGTLLDGGNDGLTLTGKTDAMVVSTSSGQATTANGNLASAQATVTRLRLGLEAHRPIPLGNPEPGSAIHSGATLTPSLEVGFRHDGGDAETGFGLDLGGGISLSSPEHGLAVELRGRGLLSHAADGFQDRGFSGSLSWRQQPDSDRGAALSLSQTVGGFSSSGVDALLNRTTMDELAAASSGNDGLSNQRLEIRLSYGLPAFNDRFTLTPELGLGLYGDGRDYRLGWRLTRLDGVDSLEFSFDATRRESANNGAAPEHGVQLRLDTRF